MPSRLRFVVAYDGAPFAGWQSQTNGNTIQDHLERAFAIVATARRCECMAPGGPTPAFTRWRSLRTRMCRTGHSLPDQWVAALNASLPPTIRVLRSRYVAHDVSRAVLREGKDLPLPDLERSHPAATGISARLARSRCRSISRRCAERRKRSSGNHDFASFAANRGKPGEEHGSHHRFRAHPSPRQMRRAGILRRRLPLQDGAADGGRAGSLRPRSGTDRAKSGGVWQIPAATPSSARLVAPAEGLFLVRVRY